MTQMTLNKFMATNPDGTLESVARQYQTSLLEVIKALPNRTLAKGDQFDTVWDAVVNWGVVTVIVHTADAILEFQGELPTGFHRHGYYNLRGKQGLSGHIKAENCQHIALVERQFMAMDTASIIFLNGDGQAMFKIFLGRDSHKQLLPEQVEQFHLLAEKLNKE